MKFNLQTKGHYDFVDITSHVEDAVRAADVQDGMASMWVKGSTAAITTIEYEQGVIKDL